MRGTIAICISFFARATCMIGGPKLGLAKTGSLHGGSSGAI
jgi:hypothetical protein